MVFWVIDTKTLTPKCDTNYFNAHRLKCYDHDSITRIKFHLYKIDGTWSYHIFTYCKGQNKSSGLNLYTG